MNKDKSKKLYHQRKNLGLCVRCGCASNTGIYCESCREYNSKRRKQLLEKGMCVCGNPREQLDKKMCNACLEKANEKLRQKRENLIKIGC